MSGPTARVDDADPNLELLRRHGWAVQVFAGRYCVAWRGADELVLAWRNGTWERVASRSGTRAAA